MVIIFYLLGFLTAAAAAALFALFRRERKQGRKRSDYEEFLNY